ncbi:unnamed protein product [Prorocentrum cordatum]|uniref:Tyr recombinase domain-containing protein n=1 Tax=Prorocentrum cordatum TaxID=2364126 RepID=A0ABN9VR21_9DINO|nr:unnamed protein product [Polarella glacialis]
MDTLDIPEPQVLVHYPDDAGGLFWHQRILVKKIAPGIWIAATPDLELVRHNLLEQRHKVLDRNAMFPANIRAQVYGFDPVPRADILALKRQAAVQAALLGDGDADMEIEHFAWVISEAGHLRFAQTLTDQEVEQATLGQTKGVALVNGLEVFVEKIEADRAKIEKWKAEREAGAGDLRVLGDHRDASGRRHLTLTEGVSMMRETSFEDWNMPGPRIAKEWLVSVRDGPGDLTTYHSQWMRRSGVGEGTAVAHIHFVMCEIVRLAIQVDQLDVSNLMSFELAMRRICQDETAVSRNPRHPDYGGLDIVLHAPVSEQGQASTDRFTEWVTARLKERASIYKQTRLWNEEQRALQAARTSVDPSKGGLTAEGAARELLASKDLYSQEPKHLAPFDLTKLKVAKGRARPRSVANFLPPLAGEMIRNPAQYIEKDEGEMEFTRQTTDPIKPYWDPVLRSSRLERWRLFRVLYELGLITFRPRLRARAALFFVKKKKPGEIRMIVDARQANACHRAPPTTRLGSAGALADLDFSDGNGSFGGVGSVVGWDPHGNEADVEDCFYNFSIDGLAEWFGFDDPLPAATIRDTYGINIGSYWDPDLHRMVAATDDVVLYPCMRAMCMGWSWALFFAQEAVSAMTSRALRPCSTLEPAMVREHLPAPDLNESGVMGSVYVDNITVLGKTAAVAREASAALRDEAERCGLPITWSYPDVVTHLETVGIELDLKQGRLRNKASRVWRFDLATRALLARGKMRGEHMEVWLGHAVSLLMLARPGYAALSAVYRFAEEAWGMRTVLPSEVRQEMRIVVGLVWLAEVDLAAPYVPHVYASDSADHGYGLMYKRASLGDLRSAFRWKEKWSFKQHLRGPRVGLVPPTDVADMGGYGDVIDRSLDYEIEPRCQSSSPCSGTAPATAFGQWLQRRAEEGQGFLELFSGEGGLSEAFKELGLKTFPGMDIKDGAHYDLLDPVVQLVILQGIRKGLFWTSRLWDFDPVRELTNLPDVIQIFLVHCSYGAPHLKRTKILANFFALSSLSSECSRDHTHVELRGFETVTLPSGARVRRNRTAGAGAYPRRLCKAWAQAAALTAPAGARGDLDAADGGDLEAQLRDASQRPASRARERLRPARQRLQAEPDLGLSAAADPDALESRYDHLRPFIVFGQDSNLEAARKQAARAKRGDEDLREAPESKIDQLMCKYFDKLMSDARHPAEGRYALWGYLTFFPRSDIAKSARLMMAREAMKGWTRRFPGSSRHPWPLSVFFLFMTVFMKDKHIGAAVALAIQLDAYLRPSEICDLRWCSVVRPSSSSSRLARGRWAVVIGNSDLGETTKTGECDDTAVLNSPGRDWVGSVLEMWARRRSSSSRPEDLVFPNLSLAKYEALFRQYSRSVLGKTGHLTPHVARHSAPSHDVLTGARSLSMVQKRGRWAHPKSVKRYEKSGRLLLQAARLPPELARRAAAAEASIFQCFQEALQ